ncbi:MAG TPA: Ig-like domain-containing protein [Terriglobales bacterium]
MKNVALLFALVLAGLLAACSSGSSAPAPTLTSITVSTQTPSVAAGLTSQFTATGNYSNNTTQNLTATATWSSSNTSVATVAAGGLAKGLVANATPVTISATVGTVSGTGSLTVTAAILQSIAVTPANDTVPLGTITAFTATGTYSDNSTQNLTSTATWMSSSPTQASITSPGGVVTALALANTAITITATSSGISGNTGLTVANATLTSIVIPSGPQNTVTIANNTSYQFAAYGLYNDGSKRNLTTKVTWASSNQAAATIGTANGRAQAVGANQSTSISATLGSVSGMATLVVSTATIQSIAVGPSGASIAPLTTQTFTAIGTFSDNSTQNISQDVTWDSNNSVATISNTAGTIGVATAVLPGGATAIISAAFGGTTGTADLTVSTATLNTITVSPATATLAVNANLALQSTGNFSDGSSQPITSVVTCASSDTTIATVSGNIVTGDSISETPATITCSLGEVNGTASITVEGFTAIAITPNNGNVAEDTSIALTATGTLTDGTTQNITSSVLWTSSNPSLATMSNSLGSYGWANGIAPGTVTVIAAFGGQVGVASLNVTDATLRSITVTPANKSVGLGARQQFSAQGSFSDLSTEDLTQQVTWTSSDQAVAIINSTGLALTTGRGSTSIGATLNEVTATPATLTVDCGAKCTMPER